MNPAKLWTMVRNRLRREEVYSKADYWDGKAQEFRGHAVSMWPNNELNALYHREQIDLFERHFPDLEGKRVLDVGCGTGRVSRYLVERGATVEGVDFSAKSIDIARSLSPDTDNPSYRVLSVFDLEVERPYDVIVSWGSLTVACKSSEELGRVFERFHRALAPGGTLFVLEPIHRGFLHRVLNLSLSEFTGLLSEHGFSVDTTEELHFWPMRLALAYTPLPKTPTVVGYQLGRWVMDLIQRGGDYKAVRATRRPDRPKD